MFCPKCGEQVPEGAKFCVYCGNDLRGLLAAKAAEAAARRAGPRPLLKKNPSPRRWRKPLLL